MTAAPLRRLLPAPAVDDASLDDAYAWPDDPCVRVNFVASLDGAATLEGRSGGLSSSADKRVFHHLRATADVVLVGAGTAKDERYRPARVPVAVVTNRLSMHLDDRLFTPLDGTARPIVFLPAAADRARVDALRPVADIVAVGEDEVDLGLVAAELERRGLRRVLCEGGPRLFAGLLGRGLVDELCLTIAPLLTSGDAPRITHGAALRPPTGARLVSALEADGALLLRYAVG